MNKIQIIAEIGVNHNGNLKLAYKLIDEAKKSGADIVKFQSFKTSLMITKNANKAIYQIDRYNKKETQFKMLKKLEHKEEFQKKIFNYSINKKIEFLMSPFDIESVKLLKKLGLKKIKIPSGEITNIPYLRLIGSLKKNIILSTGGSNIKEISLAINILNKSGTPKKIFHCFNVTLLIQLHLMKLI